MCGERASFSCMARAASTRCALVLVFVMRPCHDREAANEPLFVSLYFCLSFSPLSSLFRFHSVSLSLLFTLFFFSLFFLLSLSCPLKFFSSSFPLFLSLSFSLSVPYPSVLHPPLPMCAPPPPPPPSPPPPPHLDTTPPTTPQPNHHHFPPSFL